MAINDTWSQKYRPKTLDDFVSDDATKDRLRNNPINGNVLLVGVAGIGKTSLAKIIPTELLECTYNYINASDENGIETIRSKVTREVETKPAIGNKKVIILDEADGLSRPAQMALKNIMESHTKNIVFILTANEGYNIIPELKSRCASYTINIKFTQKDFVKRVLTIIKKENVKAKGKVVEYIKAMYPDFRRALDTLQPMVNDGELVIKDDMIPQNDLLSDIWESATKSSIKNLKQLIIDNTEEFKNDYSKLIVDLFEYVCNSDDIKQKIKMESLIILGKAQRAHSDKMLPEHNLFTALMEIRKTIKDGKSK